MTLLLNVVNTADLAGLASHQQELRLATAEMTGVVLDRVGTPTFEAVSPQDQLSRRLTSGQVAALIHVACPPVPAAVPSAPAAPVPTPVPAPPGAPVAPPAPAASAAAAASSARPTWEVVAIALACIAVLLLMVALCLRRTKRAQDGQTRAVKPSPAPLQAGWSPALYQPMPQAMAEQYSAATGVPMAQATYFADPTQPQVP